MRSVGSDTEFRDKWLTGAARAFFVAAYADFVEEGFSTDNSLDDDERAARLELPRASNGSNWMDAAPETPPNAYALAGELWNKLSCHNKCSVYVLAERAKAADVEAGKMVDNEEIDVDLFGHYLAMQAMGHGVSWFDDHEDFEIDVPSIECSQCTFSDDAYMPEES